MRTRTLIILLFLIILINLMSHESFNLHPFDGMINDARGTALGKTSLLSSSDVNFLFNNPANLVDVESYSFSMSGRAIIGSDENTGNEYDYPLHIKPTSLSFGINPDMILGDGVEVAFGIGYRTYYDFAHKYEYDYNQKASLERDYKGGFNTLVFGSGLSYQEQFRIGISYSIGMASKFEMESNSDNNYNFEDKLKGSFLTIGATALINPSFSFAARLRTGFKLTYDHEEGSEADLEIPYELALAANFLAAENLNIYLEYLTRNLGEYKISGGVVESSTNLYQKDNGYSFRSGIEYGNQMRLRAGFFMESVPYYEIDEYNNYIVELDDSPLTETGVTGGIGMRFNANMQFDLAVSYSFLQNEYSYVVNDGSEVDLDYSYDRFKLEATIGYDF